MLSSTRVVALTRGSGRNPVISVIAVLLVIWLVIGAFAAFQRHYFSRSSANCANVATTVVTILAGPLNYVGVNPKSPARFLSPASSEVQLRPGFASLMGLWGEIRPSRA